MSLDVDFNMCSECLRFAQGRFTTRVTYISIALALGCNPKWIAEQTGTSLMMIQQSYGKYIRDDGDALLRAYIQTSKVESIQQKTGTFSETHFRKSRNCSKSFMPPTEYLVVKLVCWTSRLLVL